MPTIEIPLHSRKFPGFVTLIDEEGYDLVSQHNCLVWTRWGVPKYAYTSVHDTLVYIHRMIMNASAGQEVDHINNNGFDNRRSNLRFATSSQNKFNRAKQSNNKSGFKGVSFHSSSGRWQAKITANHRTTFLGMLDSPESAALAYNDAAKIIHGDFARIEDRNAS